jgi:hypothetical protein
MRSLGRRSGELNDPPNAERDHDDQSRDAKWQRPRHPWAPPRNRRRAPRRDGTQSRRDLGRGRDLPNHGRATDGGYGWLGGGRRLMHRDGRERRKRKRLGHRDNHGLRAELGRVPACPSRFGGRGVRRRVLAGRLGPAQRVDRGPRLDPAEQAVEPRRGVARGGVTPARGRQRSAGDRRRPGRIGVARCTLAAKPRELARTTLDIAGRIRVRLVRSRVVRRAHGDPREALARVVGAAAGARAGGTATGTLCG